MLINTFSRCFQVCALLLVVSVSYAENDKSTTPQPAMTEDVKVNASDDEKAWEKAADGDLRQGIIFYLKSYPNGEFSHEANRVVQLLDKLSKANTKREADFVIPFVSLGRAWQQSQEGKPAVNILGFGMKEVNWGPKVSRIFFSPVAGWPAKMKTGGGSRLTTYEPYAVAGAEPVFPTSPGSLIALKTNGLWTDILMWSCHFDQPYGPKEIVFVGNNWGSVSDDLRTSDGYKTLFPQYLIRTEGQDIVTFGVTKSGLMYLDGNAQVRKPDGSMVSLPLTKAY